MSFSRRTRIHLFLWSLPFLLIVVALSLMVRFDLDALQRVDTRLGTPPYDWTVSHHVGFHVWLAVERIFSTIPTTVVTLLAVVLLAWRGYRRAAVWTALVMVGASVTTTALKFYFARHRPTWQVPLHQLTSQSFPSGHATYMASAMGMATVLTLLLVRRRGVRRALLCSRGYLFVLVGATGCSSGCTTSPTCSPARRSGSSGCCSGCWCTTRSRGPSRWRRCQPGARTRRLAVVLNPIKVDDEEAFR